MRWQKCEKMERAQTRRRSPYEEPSCRRGKRTVAMIVIFTNSVILPTAVVGKRGKERNRNGLVDKIV